MFPRLRLRLRAAVGAATAILTSRERLLPAALTLVAAAALFTVAWIVQRDGAEPVEVDGDAPPESTASDPPSASAGSSGSTERDSDASSNSTERDGDASSGSTGRDGDASSGSDPGASPGDPDGGGPGGGVNGGTPSESEMAAGDGGTGPDGSIDDTSPSGDQGAANTSEEGQEADDQEANDSTNAVVDVPEPEVPADGPVAPLTGELTTDSTLAQRRALAVKVGNGDRRARPQSGLAAADIVYETLIEGGKTRLMAVFHSEIPSRVGPVRSVRSADIDLLGDLSVPYLASSGANTTVLAEMRRAARAGIFVDVGGLRTSVPYSRDRSRWSPFNLYFHYEDLAGENAELPGGPLVEPVAPLFDYGSNDSPGIADAIGVTVTYHQSSQNSHIWDAAVGGWVRIQEGELMTTETDFGLTEVGPVNVAVVWMPHLRSAAAAESPQAVSYGTGDALVLTSGTVHSAVWERTEDRPGFRFTDTAGNPLSLSPGSTWVLVANSSRRFPVTEVEILTTTEGTRLLADARAAALAAGNGAGAS